MSLISELKGLDLSAIVDAKASVSLAVNTPDLQKILNEGAVTSMMGSLGGTLSSLQTSLDIKPEDMIEPLAKAIQELAGQVNVTDIPIADLLKAVADGAEILAGLIGGLNGDLNEISVPGNDTLGKVFEKAGGPIGDYAMKTVENLSSYRAIVNVVESGIPKDASALAELGIKILLPVPQQTLEQVHGQIGTVLQGLQDFSIPTARINGMVQILGQVRVAAQAGNAASVQAALNELQQIRQSTIQHIGSDLRTMLQKLEALRIEDKLQAVASATSVFQNLKPGAIEELETWRKMIAEVRAQVNSVDPQQGLAELSAMLDKVETEALKRIGGLFDEQAIKLENWVRGLLREIPLRKYRNLITSQILLVAEKINGAKLDQVSKSIRGGIDELTEIIEKLDLQALVGNATGEVENAIKSALDSLEAALGDITTRINEIADQVNTILGQAITGLKSFREAVDEAQARLAEANIEGAKQEVIETLESFRKEAEKLLSSVPIPEEMRPVVDQLIKSVESVDVQKAIGDPLKAVAEQIKLPEEIGVTVSDGLETIADVVSSVIPKQVGEELTQEIDKLFQELNNIDISGVTSGVSAQLDQVASLLEKIDPVSMVEPASEVFDKILGQLDRIHPRILLKPVIDAYDKILGSIPIPDAETINSRVGKIASTAGETAARAAAEPMKQLAGKDASLPPRVEGDQQPAPANGNQALPPGFDKVKPGDVIRMIGFLPAKLKEALGALEAGPAGDVLQKLQELCRGLAENIRKVQGAVIEVDHKIESALDDVLIQLTHEQLETQLALKAGFSASAGGSNFDLNASVALVGSVGPGSLREALAPELELIQKCSKRTSRVLSGGVAHQLEIIATNLESCALTHIGSDLQSLLDSLDPEPIAAELDGLVLDIVNKTMSTIGSVEAEVKSLFARLETLIKTFNPGAQAHKYLKVLNVLREELDLLNPSRLADELGEVHAAIRASLNAYHPRVFAQEFSELLVATALQVRSLDPAGFMPDLSGIQAQINRVPGLLPLDALNSVGASLETVGNELREIDVHAMIETINGLAPAVSDAVTDTIEALQTEIKKLLESIKYASQSGGASASISVSASVGTG